MKTRFVLNHPGLGEVLKSDGTAAACHAKAESMAAAARASAPVASGAYAASIKVVDEVHKSRVVSKVVADISYAMTVEANTGNLARSQDSAGGA